MPTPTLTISLPAKMRAYVENKVNIDGYGSVSEYIRELIRRDYHLEVQQRDTSFQRYRGNPEPPTVERPEAASRPPLASASRRYSGYRGRSQMNGRIA